VRRTIPVIISLTSFFLLWELVGRTEFIHRSLFPPATAVLTALLELALEGDLLRDLSTSLFRACTGFLVGGAFGVCIGIATGRIDYVDSFLSPVINVFRPLPPVAIIPLVIVWFGIGESSKLFSIAFAVFFPVWVNTHLGARAIPKVYFWVAKSLRLKPLAVIAKVVFPATLPFIFAGLRIGVAVSFIMVFVAELAGASAGLGYQISVSHLAYRVDRMIAALMTLGFLGATVDFIVAKSFIAIFPWLQKDLGMQ